MEDVLLTEKEAAAFLRVSVTTLRNMRSAGTLPFVRISPRRILFKQSALSQFVNENQHNTKE